MSSRLRTHAVLGLCFLWTLGCANDDDHESDTIASSGSSASSSEEEDTDSDPNSVSQSGGDVELPVQLYGASTEAGGDYTCMRTPEGKLDCWGIAPPPAHLGVAPEGIDHACGAGDWFNSCQRTPAPVQVPGIVEAMFVGWGSSCARTRDGQVWCWGELARPSNPTEVDSFTVPTPHDDLAGAVQVDPGKSGACAVFEDGRVECWMSADPKASFGGDGSTGPVTRRVLTGIPPAVELYIYQGTMCIRTEGGELWCWGRIENGNLGPTASPGPCPDGLGTCQRTPLNIPTSGPVEQVAMHYDHVCLRLADGTVECFGGNEWGQLGVGHFDAVAAITRPLGDTPTRSVLAMGSSGTCAILHDHRVSCWGKLADALPVDATDLACPQQAGARCSASPISTKLLDVEQIHFGRQHACMVRTDSQTQIHCWGRERFGELGCAAEQILCPGEPGFALEF